MISGGGEAANANASRREVRVSRPFSQVVTQGEGSLVTAHAAGDTEVFGTLPRGQNSPREAPFGLHPEQINGVGFAISIYCWQGTQAHTKSLLRQRWVRDVE